MSGVKILTQEYLFDKLKVLFPNDHIHINARKDHSFKYVTSESYLELDCWIPSLDLGFEYQDPYHYVTTWYAQRPQENVKQRDSVKKSTILNSGITLVSVPCWWDGNHETLCASIQFEDPSLFNNTLFVPIPLNPPEGFFADDIVPGVGELMVASFPPENRVQHFDWWMGEKYDGIRLCWNDETQGVYSRTGLNIFLPTCFKRLLPDIFMDGELWFGRGQFNVACLVVNAAPEFVHWHSLRMVVFDVPSRAYHATPFEERYDLLLTHVIKEHTFTIVAPRIKCKHKYHLNKFAQQIIDNAGEGVILREPKSLYEIGRSSSLIKLKSAVCDSEAMVVSIRSKSVKLGLPNGITFWVLQDNVQIPTPVVGQIVTFSFERRTNLDIPTNPVIVKVREDLLWRDVVQNSHNEKRYLNEYSNVLALDFLATQRMRKYMESYAIGQEMNPLLPSTWYTLAYAALNQFQTGKIVLRKFQGSYYKTLRHLFPELQFDKRLLPDMEIRRAFFERFARVCLFDYRKPENWYSVRRKKILSFEGAQQVLSFHGGSVSKALIELFPDIKFDKSKFPKAPMWRKSRNRRMFFEEYAKENRFDALVAENWYTQPRHKIHAKKGADRVLSYHGQNVPVALMELFPDIGLEKSRFTFSHRWENPGNRRYFFEQYAKDMGFDPLNSSAWYSISNKEVASQPGARRVLFYHNYSVAKALLDLFPNIGLENTKFAVPYRGISVLGTKQFFENFARDNSFDPLNPENWYLQFGALVKEKQTAGIIFFNDSTVTATLNRRNISLQDASGTSLYHSLSTSQALREIYPGIGLDKAKFPKPGTWYNRSTTHKFLAEYAKANAFDPLVASNWLERYKDFVALKNAHGIIFYQNKNLREVVADLYGLKLPR